MHYTSLRKSPFYSELKTIQFCFSLYEIFPMMADNTAAWQAGMQMAAIVVTLVMAVVSGFITGKMADIVVTLIKAVVSGLITGKNGGYCGYPP